jgi:flagellar basal body P-ring formation protein FlgA
MLLRLLTCLTFSMVLTANAEAGGTVSFESPAAIRAAVQAAAEQQIAPPKDQTIEIEIGEIDSRIHLATCQALEVEMPQANTPFMSARVSCRTPFWTLYVPVRVHAWGSAVVAATNLAPGTKLTASDLAMARIDILATNGAYLTDPSQADGMILRTNVRAGAPILTPLLDRPVIVHRGDTVVLTLFDGVVTIRASVIAMEDGRSGDRILVENPDSKKTVRAAVADSGGVEMRLDQARENF